MRTIRINVSHCNNNYAATVDEQMPGVIIVTHLTLDGLKEAVYEAIRFHIEGMLADGDNVPAWLLKGDYRCEWEWV